MYRLAGKIKRYGVLEPGLCRPRADGGYELLCGNRRKRACELAERPTMPVIIRDMDDETAAAAMKDSNIEHRPVILPSERAWAYKVMMDTLNHNGIKGESQSYEIMEELEGIKKSQLYRIMRLTELVLDLLDRVDTKKLAFNPAVELSHLSQKEQSAVADAMDKYQIKPSLSQAVRLKEKKKARTLTLAEIDKVLSENKKEPKPKQEKELSRFRDYFPADYTTRQMNKIITNLLIVWQSENSPQDSAEGVAG